MFTLFLIYGSVNLAGKYKGSKYTFKQNQKDSKEKFKKLIELTIEETSDKIRPLRGENC